MPDLFTIPLQVYGSQKFPVRSCKDIANCHFNDGEYWIYSDKVDSPLVKVVCFAKTSKSNLLNMLVVLLAIFDIRNGQYILERNAIIFSLGKLHLCGLLPVYCLVLYYSRQISLSRKQYRFKKF